MHNNSNRFQSGFGIVEIIVAMAIFVTIAATGATTVLQSFSINRLGNEETQANLLAQEGIEAVRSIKKLDWTSLDIGSSTCAASATRGLTNTPNWSFSGTSETLGKYTRTITIQNVCRNASEQITEPGTTYDSDIKKVTATVAWNFTAGRANSVVLTTYLSRFDKTIKKGGMLAWANLAGGASNDQIQYRTLNSPAEWSAIQNVPDLGVPGDRPAKVIKLYSSPTRNEKVLITKHYANGAGNDQYLYAQVWTNGIWGNVVQLASWTGSVLPEVKDFDGDYLNNGNFFLVYDNDSNFPQYRTWDGTVWSSALANPPNVGGNPDWIVVRARPGTNEVMLAVRDNGLDINTAYWNGSSWTVHPEHSATSTNTAHDNTDFIWSSNTPTVGALIYEDANPASTDTTPNIKIWNGTTWSASVENGNIGGIPRSMEITTRPGANEFYGCFSDNQNDINCMRSTHVPSWTLSTPEIAASTVTTTQRSFDIAFESQSTGVNSLALIVYADTAATPTQPKYRTLNPTTNTFSAQSTLAALTGNLETVRILPHPDTDDLLVVMANTNQSLFTNVWDGTNNAFYTTTGNARTNHGTLGSADTDYWFDFAWDKL